MTSEKKRLLIALAFPIACLVGLATYKGIRVHSGRTVVLPISGYDPRDLLSGHYLTYTIEYGMGNICRGQEPESSILLCLGDNETQTGIIGTPREQYERECSGIIRGICERNGRFHTGIERFYIPEERAAELDTLVRGRKGSLVLSVDANGNAVIRDLLIDGIPWKEYLKK